MEQKPLYKIAEDYLRTGIENEKWVPGDLIPSEAQLSKELNISVGTLRKAIDKLEEENLIYRHQGKGTYVSKIDFNNSLFRFFSYGSGVDSEGTTRIHKITPKREIVEGPQKVCDHLKVPLGTPLVYIERVGYDDDDKPVLFEKSWWLAEVVEGLEDSDLHIPDLFYALIAEKFGVQITRAEENLTAEIADSATADILDLDKGSPLVVLRRITHACKDKVIEFRVTRGRPDRFSYKTEIR